MKRLILSMLIAFLALGTYAGERGVCARNGSICVMNLETGEETSITSGFTDMKPSWSMEGDQIVFFRVTRMRERVQDWHTAICVINADGTGFRRLTEGNYADYNPTWTKDGTHRILYSRYFPIQARSVIHRIDLSGGEVRDEILSDTKKSEYAMSALRDGRILITSSRAIFDGIYWLFTPGEPGVAGTYEPVRYGFKMKGTMDRCSFSPDETMVAYEYKYGLSTFSYLDKVIYVADFDRTTGTVSNPKAISPKASEAMTLYPRWATDGKSVIYHSNRTKLARLYRYTLADGTTTELGADKAAAYEFFCGERWPK
jgi:Tol biopolymer transport system component